MSFDLRAAIDWCTSPIGYRPSQWRYYRLPVLVLIVDIILSFGVALLIPETAEVFEAAEPIGIPILSFWFIPTLLLVSAIEELIFRIAPLTWVMHTSTHRSVYLAAAVCTALVFGYVHGGVYNIPLQGLGGLLYAILFIKYAQGKRFGEAALILILIHTAFNAVVGLVLLASGETMF